MAKNYALNFLFRWLVFSTGMWLCITIFQSATDPTNPWIFAAAGLSFALVNALVRPILIILSAPLIFLTFGLITFLINGALISLSLLLIPGVSMKFTHAILSAIIMSILNALVNLATPLYSKK